jgi:DNA polymerase elongation subunit (family B)
MKEGSIVITFVGRDKITEAAEYIKEKYGGIIVYGDTDSTMVSIPSLNGDKIKAWEMMDTISKDVNGHNGYTDKNGKYYKPKKGLFVSPMSLEPEKVVKICCFDPKMYCYYSIKEDGTYETEKGTDIPKLHVKGLLPARRGGCQWMRNFYSKCLRNILDSKSLNDMFTLCLSEIKKLIELKFDPKNNIQYDSSKLKVEKEDIEKNLSVIKTIGQHYKNENFEIAKLKRMMQNLGKPLQVSERVRCVMVKDSRGGIKVGDLLRTLDFFDECWKASGLEYGQNIKDSENYDEESDEYIAPEGLMQPEMINVEYYFERAVDPIDKIFLVGYGKELEFYSDKFLPKQKRKRKMIPYSNPIQMLFFLLKYHIIENKGEIKTKKFVRVLESLVDTYTVHDEGFD